MTITREHKVAWLATLLAVLVAVIALHSGAGLGDIIGAALITYTGTVVGIAWKLRLQLHLGKVITATGRGAIITAVVIVLLLTGAWRSIAGAMG
ncbi:hypothetical protein ACFOSC_27930 [Streptantibioticus rubrisoli]|uniref:Uncharacterized protein n=1 Tax=Streptantibioticus rubrisoli TaxID=1387313 RepID=A0ABT1PKC2_9ACTN|nr:hypothetical protein [Streptantibioticus rubrisoli]MCQ4045818.1 hypothetical protein [Streptantibioticus rubrisoli]